MTEQPVPAQPGEVAAPAEEPRKEGLIAGRPVEDRELRDGGGRRRRVAGARHRRGRRGADRRGRRCRCRRRSRIRCRRGHRARGRARGGDHRRDGALIATASGTGVRVPTGHIRPRGAAVPSGHHGRTKPPLSRPRTRLRGGPRARVRRHAAPGGLRSVRDGLPGLRLGAPRRRPPDRHAECPRGAPAGQRPGRAPGRRRHGHGRRGDRATGRAHRRPRRQSARGCRPPGAHADPPGHRRVGTVPGRGASPRCGRGRPDDPDARPRPDGAPHDAPGSPTGPAATTCATASGRSSSTASSQPGSSS